MTVLLVLTAFVAGVLWTRHTFRDEVERLEGQVASLQYEVSAKRVRAREADRTLREYLSNGIEGEAA